jgi:drug/metabolite transporter (DMT)-like permease
MNGFPIVTAGLAAAFSALLYIILKYFQRWNVNNLQGLTFNYITASLLSFVITRETNTALLHTVPVILPPAILIGLLFISVFYLTALTAQKSGLAAVSIASKMSMAIPIVAGVLIFNDKITLVRITGILLALLAVFLSGSSSGEKSVDRSKILLPVLLFIGSGLVDTSIKISEHYFINPENINLYFSFLFGTAGCFGITILIFRYFQFKEKITLQSVIGGIILGSVNYYSLVFLVRALAHPAAESSIIFAVVNMFVVILSTISGILLFQEKPEAKKIAGLALALLALLILSQ